jgi:hypothetical protein
MLIELVVRAPWLSKYSESATSAVTVCYQF